MLNQSERKRGKKNSMIAGECPTEEQGRNQLECNPWITVENRRRMRGKTRTLKETTDPNNLDSGDTRNAEIDFSEKIKDLGVKSPPPKTHEEWIQPRHNRKSNIPSSMGDAMSKDTDPIIIMERIREDTERDSELTLQQSVGEDQRLHDKNGTGLKQRFWTGPSWTRTKANQNEEDNVTLSAWMKQRQGNIFQSKGL